MNKQEAIERIESGAFTIEDADLVVGLSYTKNIINQIDEQQKVTIPKFVAEWIEGCKRSGWHLQKALYRLDDDEKVGDWAYDEFQSTHPCGVRQFLQQILVQQCKFQSTHPCGVRHFHKAYCFFCINFNPRTRVGCDMKLDVY